MVDVSARQQVGKSGSSCPTISRRQLLSNCSRANGQGVRHIHAQLAIIRNRTREAKAHQILSAIQTSAIVGTISDPGSGAPGFLSQGAITYESALSRAQNVEGIEEDARGPTRPVLR